MTRVASAVVLYVALCVATAAASFVVITSWIALEQDAPSLWRAPDRQCVVILRGGHQPEQSCIAHEPSG